MSKTWAAIHRTTGAHRRGPCNWGHNDNPCDDEVRRWQGSGEIGHNGANGTCVSACFDHADTGGGNNACAWDAPVKAKNRRFIDHSVISTIPQGYAFGMECDWDVNDAMLRKMSGDTRYISASIKDNSNRQVNIWEQLLFGVTVGRQNTKGRGYCDNVSHLLKKVHQDGKTCYDIIKNKNQAAEADRKGREYCKRNPTAQVCKCINISQSGGVTYCLKNPTLPGCKKVVETLTKFRKRREHSLTYRISLQGAIMVQLV